MLRYPIPSRRAVAGLLLVASVAGCGFVPTPSGHDTPLAIQRFIAVPAEVAAGAATMLSWDVEGAESVELDGIGIVQANGSRTVRPTVTTTYRLVAVAGTSLATASIRVVVVSASPSPSPSPVPSPG